jgi:N-methylhydantoinase A
MVAIDTRSNRVVTTKTPSTPADPAVGFLTAVEKMLGILGAAAGDIASILHGQHATVGGDRAVGRPGRRRVP